jgi:hypothetical protein
MRPMMMEAIFSNVCIVFSVVVCSSLCITIDTKVKISEAKSKSLKYNQRNEKNEPQSNNRINVYNEHFNKSNNET